MQFSFRNYRNGKCSMQGFQAKSYHFTEKCKFLSESCLSTHQHSGQLLRSFRDKREAARWKSLGVLPEARASQRSRQTSEESEEEDLSSQGESGGRGATTCSPHFQHVRDHKNSWRTCIFARIITTSARITNFQTIYDRTNFISLFSLYNTDGGNSYVKMRFEATSADACWEIIPKSDKYDHKCSLCLPSETQRLDSNIIYWFVFEKICHFS